MVYGRQFSLHINGKLLNVPLPDLSCLSLCRGELSPTFRCEVVLGSQLSSVWPHVLGAFLL